MVLDIQMKKITVKSISLAFLITLSGALSACQSMSDTDPFSNRAEAPAYENTQSMQAKAPKSTPIHDMAEQYGDAPIGGVSPSRLVWNDWHDEAPAAARIKTADNGASIPEPMFEPSNLQTDNNNRIKFNKSVTVYPLDGSFSEYEPVAPGHFWETMTVDSRGVTVKRMGNESGNSKLYAGNNDQPVIYFNHASSRLSPADKKKIKAVVDTVKSRNDYLIRVTGYASRPASNASTELERQIVNLNMGSKRAIAVSLVLLQSSIPASNIQTITRGAAFAKDNDPADRRTTIEILNR
jgi:outer membrane protein OmpA-like peptidoglycan-associated protein